MFESIGRFFDKGASNFRDHLRGAKQKMDELGARMIELAVRYACPRTHALNVSRADYRSGAEAVFVLERAVDHVRDDLHVAVRMRAESFSRLNPIFVDDPKRSEPHELRIVVIREGKGVIALEPAVLGVPSFARSANSNHVSSEPATPSPRRARSSR